MGKFDNCVNILETAIQSQNACPSVMHNSDDRSALLSLYRTVIETLLDTETYKEAHKTQILNIIGEMVPKVVENKLLQVEAYFENCVQTFLQEPSSENEEDTFFLPNFVCDTVACYAYLIYVRDSDINRAISLFKNCINHYKDRRYIKVLYLLFISCL